MLINRSRRARPVHVHVHVHVRRYRKSQHHRDEPTQLCPAEQAMKKKRTRREKFLTDMERVVP